jgi:2,3-diketo-5-methylthio-1-phosphopentane phosphatase
VTRAGPPPPLRADASPVSVLVDYDGTISRRDVGDELMRTYVADQATVAAKDADYDAGRVGSRELMIWDLSVLPADADLLRRAAATAEQDEGFARIVEVCRGSGAAVEVVSDGFGFHVEPNLARMGVTDVPVATNEARLDGPDRGMSFPYGHPRCFVCGTCKRERVRLHQQAGRIVVFVGDGTSDRFAAAHAEVVFAKDSLARMCEREGWPYHTWRGLDEVAGWLAAAFADDSLPRTPADLGTWRSRHAPAPRPFICGPEVWGPGRTTPGPGPGTKAGAP